MTVSFRRLLLLAGLSAAFTACKDDKVDPVTPAPTIIPTIISFAPNSAPVGTSITITGTNLTGATGVVFNSTAATVFAVTSATTMTATVPAGATTGLMKVTTPGGTATSSATFAVVAANAPTIVSFTPASGVPGTVVTITGTNLGGATVMFNGVAAPSVTVVNATTVTATAPVGVTSGVISVITANGTATSATAFSAGALITVPAGNLTTTTTWTANNKYLLTGAVYVPDGVTLTIEPGTIIKGDKATNGSLVVRQGGMLMANGTATAPIVFTSNQAAGSRAPGDWGGVVLTGRAPVNFAGGTGTVEGFDISIPYGGTNAADNSGSLKYVRIEFAGIALTPGNEINGLTLAGVGNGTTVEHIQVVYGGDDAFEFFGGTVNAKYLVASRTTDDMFDTDNGFSGKVQYCFGISDPNLSDQTGSSNGMESDNDATSSANAPQTTGAFANMTVLGPQATTGAALPPGGNKFGVAAQIRRNSALNVYNTVLAGWPKGLDINGTASQANFDTGTLKVMGTVLAGIPAGLEFIGATTMTNFNLSASMNQLMADNTALQLNANAFTLNSPNPLPNAGSPLLTGGATLPAGFEPTTYRGAFSTMNWLAGWTNFDPQNTVY